MLEPSFLDSPLKWQGNSLPSDVWRWGTLCVQELVGGVVSRWWVWGIGFITSIQETVFGGLQGAAVGCFCGLQGTATIAGSMEYC